MKIKEIESYERDYLTPRQIAEVLGCDAYSINLKAKADIEDGKNRLQFPFVMMGNRVKIPRQAFLKFWKGETAD